jgi:hypothetical protein
MHVSKLVLNFSVILLAGFVSTNVSAKSHASSAASKVASAASSAGNETTTPVCKNVKRAVDRYDMTNQVASASTKSQGTSANQTGDR